MANLKKAEKAIATPFDGYKGKNRTRLQDIRRNCVYDNIISRIGNSQYGRICRSNIKRTWVIDVLDKRYQFVVVNVSDFIVMVYTRQTVVDIVIKCIN